MDEKTMVNDILAGVKSDLTAYQTAITEAENMQLRQTKGYYQPAQKATVTEIQTVKTQLEQ